MISFIIKDSRKKEKSSYLFYFTYFREAIIKQIEMNLMTTGF